MGKKECKKELVSVIIPVFNAQISLKRCVKSVINQTYKCLEIILINDGSTDKSLELCNGFQLLDDRIRVIDQENQGVSSARNKGIDIAKGKYVCFVDSDDWIEPQHIQNMISYITQCDCVVSGYIKDSKIQQQLCYLNPGRVNLVQDIDRNIGPFFWNGYIHPCWNKLFKLDIIRKYGISFNFEIHISEDSLFCIEYLMHCKFMIFTADVLYHYCVDNNESSLSKRLDLHFIDIYERVYTMLLQLLEQGNCEEDDKELILVKTIYPQIYSSILKILDDKTYSISKKKKLFCSIEKYEYFMYIIKKAKRISENKFEKIMLILIEKRHYFIMEILWKVSKKRLQ